MLGRMDIARRQFTPLKKTTSSSRLLNESVTPLSWCSSMQQSSQSLPSRICWMTKRTRVAVVEQRAKTGELD